MVYGELGRYSLDITVKSRLISFWAKLALANNNKYSTHIYRIVRSMHDNGIHKTKWLDNIKNILDDCGLSYVWLESNSVNGEWLVLKVKQTLKDHFIQEWHRSLDTSSKASNYRLYKTEFRFEDYLVKLPNVHRIVLCRFRLGCSKLPVERGRYHNVPRERRYCSLCHDGKVGDQFHLLLECTNLDVVNFRKRYLSKYYLKSVNVLKLHSLFNMKNYSKIVKLARYVAECSKLL